MTQDWEEQRERLRGSLEAKGLQARGLERFARNPECKRLVALCLAGLRPAEVAREVYGEPDREGQSPFALGAGSRFEHLLFKDDAERLVELYTKAGRFLGTRTSVLSIPEEVPGTSSASRQRRLERTSKALADRWAGDLKAPDLIIHPRLEVELLGQRYEIEPDALVAAEGERLYRVVEIKSYADRRGKTDPASLRGACRQAAVGVVGLRQELIRMGAGEEAAEQVAAWGDLILRKPGSMWPALHPMTLCGEVESLERVLIWAADELSRIEAMVGPGESLADRNVLDRIPNRYCESCREFCGLATVCKRQALEVEAPILLGSRAEETLEPITSLVQALALVRGEVAPRNGEEEALRVRLARALDEYRRVTGHVA